MITKKLKKIRRSFPIVFIIPITILITLVFFGSIIFFSYLFVFQNRAYPFISVAFIDVSGKTRTEIETLIKKKIKENKPEIVRLSLDSHFWKLDLAKLNLVYFPTKTSQKTLLVARSKNITQNVPQLIDAFMQKINLAIDYQIDQPSLDQTVASLSARIDLPAVPPTIKLDKTKPKDQQIIIEPGVSGKKLDSQKTTQLILQRLGYLETGDIVLPVEDILPPISTEMVQKTEIRAQNLIDKKLIIKSEEQTWELNDLDLINFLYFQGGWDEEKLATYTASLAQTIDRPAQNALFKFESGKVLEFKPAKPGITLSFKKNLELLKQALTDLENTQNSVKIDLIVDSRKPEIDTAQVNNFGINSLIGKGQSWFYGSIAPRIHNVKLAADKLNGILVAPGDTFSFNSAIGDISQATGFQQAYVIQNGRTVLGDGGGVCQVSSTLFRTMLDSGVPIEERQPHAYRVSYYEHNSGPGFDATVYYPSVDLKFKNDTPAHILIQTTTDTKALKLTIEFYGTSDGRKTSLSAPRIWDQVPPPPDLYQDDPSLAIGETKQVDWKAWGAKVSFNWKVTKGDEILQERTFYSSYRPWQAVFLKGTKT